MGKIVIPKGCDPQSDEMLDSLISLAIPYASYTERDARYLINKMDKIVAAGTWPRRLSDGPKTWERFCSEVLGYDSRYFDQIRHGIEILKERGVENPTVGEAQSAAIGKHGGDRRSSNFQDTNGNLKVGGTNRADYLIARIARERPDIQERMKAGEFRSVRQAALEAGIVKPEFSCPLEPQAAARRILNRFKGDSLLELIRVLANHAGYVLVPKE